jgi:hypothetical protein
MLYDATGAAPAGAIMVAGTGNQVRLYVTLTGPGHAVNMPPTSDQGRDCQAPW